MSEQLAAVRQHRHGDPKGGGKHGGSEHFKERTQVTQSRSGDRGPRIAGISVAFGLMTVKPILMALVTSRFGLPLV